MFCSTIIPTIGRSTLSRAVRSILDQDFSADAFEIIVVNDSGEALAKPDWQDSDRVRVVHTNRRERSVARNTGASMAKGAYLHFLDDDDWMAPCALRTLWDGARTSEAAWIYGVSQVMDRKGHALVQLRHGLNGNGFVQAMAGEWIPLQASLIHAETFFSVGGFNTTIVGPEDVDLLRRVTLVGSLAEVPEIVAFVAMGPEGSSTDYTAHATQSRWARERVLGAAGAFARMRGSAASSFWRGRMVRVYLTSLAWNLQARRWANAASRAALASASIVGAGPALFSPAFWRAVARPYASVTFDRGIRAARDLRGSR